jgi:hypothetical protein
VLSAEADGEALALFAAPLEHGDFFGRRVHAPEAARAWHPTRVARVAAPTHQRSNPGGWLALDARAWTPPTQHRPAHL